MQLHMTSYFERLGANKEMYLARSMNFSRLFCMTFSNNLYLFTRASLSSVPQSDPGFGSCEQTSPVASFVCCSESFSGTFCPPAASRFSSLCSIFSVYTSRCPPNLRWAGGDQKHHPAHAQRSSPAHAQWCRSGHDLRSAVAAPQSRGRLRLSSLP